MSVENSYFMSKPVVHMTVACVKGLNFASQVNN